jgi:hypothetical protein
MRQGVGYLALLLPVVIAVGYRIFGGEHGGFLGSISESYYTVMRDVFVGTLCAVAFFLFAYQGYSDFEDRFFNVLGGLCVVVAFFAMNSTAVEASPLLDPPSCHHATAMDPTCSIVLNDRVLIFHYETFGWIHFAAAATLFASLGYVSIHFFTRSDATDPGPEKRRRNTIFRVCGFAIWGALGLYGLFSLAQWFAPDATWVRALDHWPVLFVVEWVCLWAFGFSWLVKGDGVRGLRDREGASAHGL